MVAWRFNDWKVIEKINFLVLDQVEFLIKIKNRLLQLAALEDSKIDRSFLLKERR
jgi:hypothetical protein